MEIPAYIILFSFFVCMSAVLLLKFFRVPKMRSLKVLTITFSVVWVCTSFFGEFIYFWAGNATCSKYLGCVAGFGGFDAFEHLFFGMAAVLAIVWISERFPKYSVLHETRWKTMLIVVALVMLASAGWEIFECAHDALRVDILHQSLRNFSLHINLLDQPSNVDTMGDLTFSLIGSVVGLFFI